MGLKGSVLGRENQKPQSMEASPCLSQGILSGPTSIKGSTSTLQPEILLLLPLPQLEALNLPQVLAGRKCRVLGTHHGSATEV